MIAYLSLLTVLPHGDLHERIGQLSAALAENPCDATLLAKRADLYHQHQEWSKALADIRRASELRDHPSDRMLESIILLESGKTREAKRLLDRILKNSPQDTAALVARARAHALLQQNQKALKDYLKATELISKPSPDLFLEQARCFVRTGSRAQAIESLDKAMERIGYLPSLQRYALDLEVELGRHEAALARLSQLDRGSPARFDLMLLRGEVLWKANRRDEARKVFADTLATIESQPERMNLRINDIRNTVRNHLQELQSK